MSCHTCSSGRRWILKWMNLSISKIVKRCENGFMNKTYQCGSQSISWTPLIGMYNRHRPSSTIGSANIWTGSDLKVNVWMFSFWRFTNERFRRGATITQQMAVPELRIRVEICAMVAIFSYSRRFGNFSIFCIFDLSCLFVYFRLFAISTFSANFRFSAISGFL